MARWVSTEWDKIKDSEEMWIKLTNYKRNKKRRITRKIIKMIQQLSLSKIKIIKLVPICKSRVGKNHDKWFASSVAAPYRLAFTIPAETHVCNMKNTDANNSIPHRNGDPAKTNYRSTKLQILCQSIAKLRPISSCSSTKCHIW